MADINAYALGLELQLQSKQAFDALDELESRLGKIEKQAASIAPAALNTKEQQQWNQATELGADNVKILDDTIRELDANLVITKQAYHDMTQGIGALSETQEALRDSFEDSYKEHEKILRQFKRMELQGIKLNDQEKEKIKKIHESMDAYEDLRDATAKFIKVQEKQKKETEEQLSILDQFGSVGKIIKSVLSGVTSETLALGLISSFLTKSLMDLSAMMDAYATVSYRALGTQSDLISVTNELRSSLGATAEEGIKTISALAHAGFRATDSIGELSRANYMFSQATGISADVTADYQRRIVVMTGSVALANQGLEAMSNVIRKSGMSAEQAKAMISGLTESMRALHFFYGSDATVQATKDMAGFIGAVHAAGGEVGTVTAQLNEMAKSPIKTRIAFAMVHADIVNGVPQWGDYFFKVSKKMGQLNENAVKMGKSLSSEAMIKALHISAEQADSYLLLWERSGKTEEGFRNLLAAGQEGADQTRDFNEAMSTFKKSMQRVLEPLLAVGTAILDVVGPAFVALLKPIQITVTAIAKVLEFMFKIPVAGGLVKAAFAALLISPLISKLGGLANMFGKVSTVMSGLGKATKLVGGIFPKLVETFKFLGPIASKSSTLFKQFTTVSEEAGGGLLGMGKGALSVVGNLAKVHPVITAIVVAVGAALLIVPKFFEMIDSGNENVRNLGIVLAALFAPLVVFYVQLRAIWEVLKAFWDVFSEVMSEVLKPAVDAFKALTGSTGKSLGVMKTINMVMEKFGNIVRNVFRFMVPIAKTLMIVFMPVLLLFKALTGSFNPLVGVFKVISKSAEFLKNIISSIWEFFKPIIDKIKWAYDKLPDFLKSTKEHLKPLNDREHNAIIRKIVPLQAKIATALTGKEIPFEAQQRYMASLLRGEANKNAALHAAHAVKQVYTPEQRRAEPVANRVRQIAKPMTEVERKTLEAHMKIAAAVAELHATVENTSAKQDKHDKLFRLLEQYLPIIAEGKDKGLSGSVNSWT